MIKCAAIKVGDVTLSKEPPARHVHLMRELDRILDGADCRFEVEQGFLTEDGKFVDRIEAMKIAKEAGQTFIRPPYNRELFSENLW